jgi:hypothetical protein
VPSALAGLYKHKNRIILFSNLRIYSGLGPRN